MSVDYSEAENWMTSVLETEQRLITFRELARQIGCHVHGAKNMMRRYLDSHPEVIPTYLLSGPLLATATLAETSVATQSAPSATQSLANMSATQKIRIVDMDQMSDDERNSEADMEEERQEEALEQSTVDVEMRADARAGPEDEAEHVVRWGVVLVEEQGLEEKQRLFMPGQATVHVYALTPGPLKDSAQIMASFPAMRERRNYNDPSVYGTTTGEPLVADVKPLRDGAMSFSAAKTTDNKKPADKKSAKLTFSKTEATKPTERKAASRSRSPSKPLDTASTSKAADVKPKAPTKSASRAKRRIITSDDEEDEPPVSSSSAKPDSKRALEPTSSMVRAEDQAAMEAMMTMDMDFDDIEEVEAAPKAAPVKPAAKSKGSGKRKRRQVKKSRTEMDAKGYMVTKDYFTDESYSGSDTDVESPPTKSGSSKSSSAKASSTAAAKPSSKGKPTQRTGSESSKASPKPAPKNTASKKSSSMGQSTLANFFKKK